MAAVTVRCFLCPAITSRPRDLLLFRPPTGIKVVKVCETCWQRETAKKGREVRKDELAYQAAFARE